MKRFAFLPFNKDHFFGLNAQKPILLSFYQVPTKQPLNSVEKADWKLFPEMILDISIPEGLFEPKWESVEKNTQANSLDFGKQNLVSGFTWAHNLPSKVATGMHVISINQVALSIAI